MERQVKVFKKLLETNSKRNPKNMKRNKEIISKLNTVDYYELVALDYNKAVTKVSRDSSNKRCMLFPNRDLNMLVSFINKKSTPGTFTVKWYKGKDAIEAGLTQIYIYSENNEIYFTVQYIYTVNGVTNKAQKVTTIKFDYDEGEVIKLGNNTTEKDSFLSAGYVILMTVLDYITKKEEKEIDCTYDEYFVQYSNEVNKVENDYDIDNLINLMSTSEESVNIEDEDLISVSYL